MASKKKLRRRIRELRAELRECEKEIRLLKLYEDTVDHSNEKWKAICSSHSLKISELEGKIRKWKIKELESNNA